jgi:uncharacterized protein (DUF2147 family)
MSWKAGISLSPLLAWGSAAAAAPAGIEGLWMNPKGSVAVRTRPCGDKLCGFIVWVNAAAAADAKESGVARPVGTEVLRDYVPEARGSWRGTLYVPDMGRSFRGTLTALDPNDLRVTGCLIGGFICRSQTWHRRPS